MWESGHRIRWIAWLVLAAMVAGLRGESEAGDPVVATALLTRAKEAIGKKKYADALTLLDKARAEAPELREVLYWIGSVQEKSGHPGPALAAFREYRTALADAERDGSLAKGEAELGKKAGTRIAALAPGEAEDDRLRSVLAADLLSLARGKAKDPAATAIALEALLRSDPSHPEARALLGRITSAPSGPGAHPLPTALDTATRWKDVIAIQGLGQFPRWTYTAPGLCGDAPGRDFLQAPNPIQPGRRFALDLEVRVAATHQTDWALGFGLANGEDRLAVILLEERRMIVRAGHPQGMLQDLSDLPIPRIEIGTWHRLSVLVEGNRVQVFADGKKPMSLSLDGIGPETRLGLYQRFCRAEYRTWRWSPVE